MLIVLLIHNSTDKYRSANLLISEADFQSLIQNRKETNKKLLTKVTINNFPLFYDELKSRWFYSTPADPNPSDFSIGYTGISDELKIALIKSADSGTSETIIAYTGTEYRLYPLVFTTLPIIRIECETANIWKTPLPIKFTLFDNRIGIRQPLIVSDGLIHSRGNTTNIFPKISYRLILTAHTTGEETKENQQSLLGLRNDGDWMLYPGYVDQEKVRNVFSSNLWFHSCAENNEFGLKNGNEYRYAEMFINDQYWGLYALGYPIDSKQMGIHADIKGNYNEFILKQRMWGPNYPDYPNLDQFLFPQFDISDAEWGTVSSIMESYFQYLESGAPDGLSHNDEGSTIDIWLYSKLIQHIDSVSDKLMLNNVIYTIKSSDYGRKIVYTPWDMDSTWGNNYDSPLSPENNSPEMTFSPVHMMLKRNDPEIRGKIKQRYQDLRAASWSNSTVDTMIDGLEQEIYDSGAYVRDMERWPEGSYQDPELKLSLFREYVHERFRSMDEYIANL